MKTKVFFDTEFTEDGRTIDLISIGLVRIDGAELYLESAEADLSRAGQWVQDNVLVHLTGDTVSRADMAEQIRRFVGPDPEFWAYYADYDWVALCQLYGTMLDLPVGWPKFCMDIKQRAVDLGDPPLPKQDSTEHHALADARWNLEAWKFLHRVK